MSGISEIKAIKIVKVRGYLKFCSALISLL